MKRQTIPTHRNKRLGGSIRWWTDLRRYKGSVTSAVLSSRTVLFDCTWQGHPYHVSLKCGQGDLMIGEWTCIWEPTTGAPIRDRGYVDATVRMSTSEVMLKGHWHEATDPGRTPIHYKWRALLRRQSSRKQQNPRNNVRTRNHRLSHVISTKIAKSYRLLRNPKDVVR